MITNLHNTALITRNSNVNNRQKQQNLGFASKIKVSEKGPLLRGLHKETRRGLYGFLVGLGERLSPDEEVIISTNRDLIPVDGAVAVSTTRKGETGHAHMSFIALRTVAEQVKIRMDKLYEDAKKDLSNKLELREMLQKGDKKGK